MFVLVFLRFLVYFRRFSYRTFIGKPKKIRLKLRKSKKKPRKILYYSPTRVYMENCMKLEYNP